MKKIILTSAILFATVAATFAQTTGAAAIAPDATDIVTLNVKLNPIQTLVVNPSQKTVDLEYSTKANYEDGVASKQANHLEIYSTGGFVVTVQSKADDMSRKSGSETISASTIKIQAENGSNALTGATFADVSLSATPTNLINSSVGGVNKNFNVTYSGMGADAYVNKYFKNETPTVYTTTVTYAIVAQ